MAVMETGVMCNIGYPLKRHRNPKYREIPFPRYLLASRPLVSKYLGEHESNTVVIYA